MTIPSTDPSIELPTAELDVAHRSSRKPRAAIGVLVLLALAMALVWWGWRPHYRPGAEPGETFGVDVSNHQGEIDWPAVATDDIDFAYIKATEGGDFVDVSFARNWTGADAAGLDIGAYHFFTLCRSGADQAQNFLNVVPAGSGDLLPALDLEFPGNCSERPTTEAEAGLVGPADDDLFDLA